MPRGSAGRTWEVQQLSCAFSSCTPRGENVVYRSPGPGRYNVPQLSWHSLMRQGRPTPSFGSTTPRRTLEIKYCLSPGPGSYECASSVSSTERSATPNPNIAGRASRRSRGSDASVVGSQPCEAASSARSGSHDVVATAGDRGLEEALEVTSMTSRSDFLPPTPGRSPRPKAASSQRRCRTISRCCASLMQQSTPEPPGGLYVGTAEPEAQRVLFIRPSLPQSSMASTSFRLCTSPRSLMSDEPGPGHYEASSEMAVVSTRTCCSPDAKAAAGAPFGTGAARCGLESPTNGAGDVGPGDYLVEEPRFQRAPARSETPGWLGFNTSATAHVGALPWDGSAASHPPRWTASATPPGAGRDTATPGPGAYYEEDVWWRPSSEQRRTNTSMGFTEERFNEVVTGLPGSPTTERPPAVTREHLTRLKIATRAALGLDVKACPWPAADAVPPCQPARRQPPTEAFLATKPRFTRRLACRTPGPGAYDPQEWTARTPEAHHFGAATKRSIV